MNNRKSFFNGLTLLEVATKTEPHKTNYTLFASFRGVLPNHPASKEELEYISRELASKLVLDDVDFFVGLARGGVPVAFALAYQTSIPYIIAWDTVKKKEGMLNWLEEGAGKYLYMPHPGKGKKVILVDDETNTGSTFCNAIRIMQDNGIYVKDVCTVFEIEKPEGLVARLRLQEKNFDLKTLESVKEPILSEGGIYYFPD